MEFNKKLLALTIAFAIALSNPAMAAWDKTLSGSDNISDLDTYLTSNNTALEGILSGLSSIKIASNLKIVRASTTSVTVTADQLFLKSDTTISARETSVNETIAITTSGVSGLRTGLVEASNTWYYIVIMRKSSDGTVNGILDTSTTPTLETGYDQYAVVGAVRNNSSSDFIDFYQYGNEYWYSTWQTMASSSGSVSPWTSIDTSSFVPSGLSSVAFGVGDSINSYVQISNDSTVNSGQTTLGANKWIFPYSSTPVISWWRLNIKTSDTIYWGCSNAGSTVSIKIAGFFINKL